MGIISWIVVGGLAGWIGSMITKNNEKMGAFANIIAGIVGAFVGGLIMRFFGFDGITGFNLWSIIVATLGAVIVLFIVNGVKSN